MLHDPFVAIMEHEMKRAEDLEAVFKAYSVRCRDFTRALVVIVGGMEMEVWRSVMANLKERNFPIIPLKSPGVGRDRYEELLDISAVCGGAKIFAQFGGTDRELITPMDLGEVKFMDLRRDGCRFEFEGGPLVDDRIKEARGRQDDFSKERLSRLLGKLGVIKIGGWSGSERGYMEQVIDDGVRAAQGALEAGVVYGGGWAYGMMGYPEVTQLLGGGFREDRVFHVGAGDLPLEECRVWDSMKVVREVFRSASSLAREIQATKHIML
jgi:chaperonin GroEL